MTDSDIVELFIKRDEKAIVQVTEKYGAMCKSIAFNILGNQSDSEECFNDVLYKLWDSIPPQKPSNLSGYISTIARNTAIDIYRRVSAEKRVPSELTVSIDELYDLTEETSQDFISEEEQREREETFLKVLNDFLSRQKKEYRQVFVCRYYYFDAVKDIADKFSMSESKVKSILFRLRCKLKKSLEKEGLM